MRRGRAVQWQQRGTNSCNSEARLIRPRPHDAANAAPVQAAAPGRPAPPRRRWATATADPPGCSASLWRAAAAGQRNCTPASVGKGGRHDQKNCVACWRVGTRKRQGPVPNRRAGMQAPGFSAAGAPADPCCCPSPPALPNRQAGRWSDPLTSTLCSSATAMRSLRSFTARTCGSSKRGRRRQHDARGLGEGGARGDPRTDSARWQTGGGQRLRPRSAPSGTPTRCSDAQAAGGWHHGSHGDRRQPPSRSPPPPHTHTQGGRLTEVRKDSSPIARPCASSQIITADAYDKPPGGEASLWVVGSEQLVASRPQGGNAPLP